MVNNEGLAGQIRAELGRRQKSILWLSEQTGIARPTIARRLADEDEFKLSEITKVSRVLGMQPSDLIETYYHDDHREAA